MYSITDELGGGFITLKGNSRTLVKVLKDKSLRAVRLKRNNRTPFTVFTAVLVTLLPDDVVLDKVKVGVCPVVRRRACRWSKSIMSIVSWVI